MSNYNFLFSDESYKNEECVELISVNKDTSQNCIVTIPNTIFCRLVLIGKAYQMHYLSLFSSYEDYELHGVQIDSFYEELLFLSKVVNDKLLEEYMIQIFELLKQCNKDSTAILKIIGN